MNSLLRSETFLQICRQIFLSAFYCTFKVKFSFLFFSSSTYYMQLTTSWSAAWKLKMLVLKLTVSSTDVDVLKLLLEFGVSHCGVNSLRSRVKVTIS